MSAESHLGVAVMMAIGNSWMLTDDPRKPGTTDLGKVVGMSGIERKAVPTMSDPSEFCSTEEHGDHLRHEAGCDKGNSLYAWFA